jgi:DNA-binding response OmpR family regulator
MTRILIVEDDGALSYDLAHKVAGWGYEVRVARDGGKGLEAIRDWQPDLVLSDINMPHTSGIDLVQNVKRLGADYADMAFLFLSSRAAPKMVVEGIRVGADDYLVKPVDYKLLQVKLAAHLRRRDKMLDKFEEKSWSPASMRSGTQFATTFAGATLALGVIVFVLAYWFKTVLGINIFDDMHFSDLFG